MTQRNNTSLSQYKLPFDLEEFLAEIDLRTSKIKHAPNLARLRHESITDRQPESLDLMTHKLSKRDIKEKKFNNISNVLGTRRKTVKEPALDNKLDVKKYDFNQKTGEISVTDYTQ